MQNIRAAKQKKKMSKANNTFLIMAHTLFWEDRQRDKKTDRESVSQFQFSSVSASAGVFCFWPKDQWSTCGSVVIAFSSSLLVSPLYLNLLHDSLAWVTSRVVPILWFAGRVPVISGRCNGFWQFRPRQRAPLERNSNSNFTSNSRPSHKQSVWLSPLVYFFWFSCVYSYQLNSLNL